MSNKIKEKCISNPNNLLFPSYYKNGKIRTMIAFEIQFKALCDSLGIDRDVRIVKKNKKGLCVHALRHTAITIANTSPNANVVNTALMAGHTALSMENIYTHTNIEALKNIKTASEIILNKQAKTPLSEEEKEQYDMYLKLKNKFED